MRHLVSVAAVSVMLCAAATARAADPAAAQALFDEGKRLVAQQQYAQACPKFEESQRLDPGLGTLFHLADCEEKSGRTATAWATYLEVASEAKAQGEAARMDAARTRATALERTLPKLEIDAGAESANPALVIVRDGAPVGRAQWGTSVPVDPGRHVIEARAPGKGTWTTTVTIAAGGREAVTVPLLADAPVAVVTTAPQATTTISGAEVDAHTTGKSQRTAGIVLGAVGIAGLGVGGYFSVVSLVRHHDGNEHCGAAGCDAAGVSYRDDARRAGNAATVSLAAGGAFFVAGLITYLTAPHESPFPQATASRKPVFAVGPGSAFVQGVW